MSPPKSTRWSLDPHTQAKHLILRRYLEAWLPIMAAYNGRIVFIDGFAGPGRYANGAEGSPLIALRTLLDHPQFASPRSNRQMTFIFTEADQIRFHALQKELARIETPSWVTVQSVPSAFAPAITDLLDSIEANHGTLAPTFAFIDPFGFAGVPLQLISRILDNPRCECLITFMFEPINRFIAHPNQRIQAQFDQLFGGESWRPLLQLPTGPTRRNALVELYRSRLTSVAGAEYVRTFEMIDGGNRTEYFLYFATHSLKGLSKMKEAMWRADPVGGQAFSDFTVSNQMVLLQPQADLDLLRQMLVDRFSEQGLVDIEDVARFVLVDTPFSESIHLKRKTLGPMESEGVLDVRRPPGKRNRAGEYPDGTRLRFL
jgi:three-Cys-motif partner protein